MHIWRAEDWHSGLINPHIVGRKMLAKLFVEAVQYYQNWDFHISVEGCTSILIHYLILQEILKIDLWTSLIWPLALHSWCEYTVSALPPRFLWSILNPFLYFAHQRAVAITIINAMSDAIATARRDKDTTIHTDEHPALCVL